MNLEALLRSHAAWERISYARLAAPHGAGAARNLALRMIRGEYVAFLDPDNRYAPDHLERAVEAIARTGATASLAGSRLAIERTDGAASGAEQVGEIADYGGAESDVALLEIAHAVPLDALVLYRGLFDRVGTFNDAVPLLDDWDFTLRLARAVRFAPAGSTSVTVTARLGLFAQRLGGALPHYAAVLDALYAAHPVESHAAERRARHRVDVANAVGAAHDWLREPHGVAAFMSVLAGRSPAVAGAIRQPA
jgi:glycosyltransferase involved in cell wall biosynthesis